MPLANTKSAAESQAWEWMLPPGLLLRVVGIPRILRGLPQASGAGQGFLEALSFHNPPTTQRFMDVIQSCVDVLVLSSRGSVNKSATHSRNRGIK